MTKRDTYSYTIAGVGGISRHFSDDSFQRRRFAQSVAVAENDMSLDFRFAPSVLARLAADPAQAWIVEVKVTPEEAESFEDALESWKEVVDWARWNTVTGYQRPRRRLTIYQDVPKEEK